MDKQELRALIWREEAKKLNYPVDIKCYRDGRVEAYSFKEKDSKDMLAIYHKENNFLYTLTWGSKRFSIPDKIHLARTELEGAIQVRRFISQATNTQVAYVEVVQQDNDTDLYQILAPYEGKRVKITVDFLD